MIMWKAFQPKTACYDIPDLECMWLPCLFYQLDLNAGAHALPSMR